ncbi:ADP-ribosylation factor GTPase-activating family protein [Aestuariivivens sediminicola]|uniref:hypothetical protein n=1 Tax=Aestuariivivens sediminicola TaxID=2913560 RepID=UPI001F56BDE5|nr:hypothetical protein [Aestuariivivens sediminicola]
MNFKNFIFFFVSVLLAFACSSSSSDDLSNDPDPDPNPNPITYDAHISTIMSSNCTSCHGNPPTQNAPFSLTTFNEVRTRVNSIISRINNTSNPMPPAGLMPQSTRELIQQWKDDGLLEN